MAQLKSAYLIYGDDHGRIAERRANFRSLAERESGANGLEIFEGERANPDEIAAALGAMTFSIGWRFILVEGVERWKGAELSSLVDSFKLLPPETTVAFFGREEGRTKVPDQLKDAVNKAGGDVAIESALKPWELPKWVKTQAAQLGFDLDIEAARLLVDRVGDRQQRLLRELEKTVLCFGAGSAVGIEEVDQLTVNASERKAWSLGDTVISGDASSSLRLLLELLTQGERSAALLYPMASRVRIALEVKEKIDRGEPKSDLKRNLRMPPKAAERLISQVTGADTSLLVKKLVALSDLELATRGGGKYSEVTAAVLTVVE